MKLSIVLLLATASSALSISNINTNQVTNYREISTSIPIGNEGETSAMPIFVPVLPGSRQIADPATLFDHVKITWDTIIENNQAGLVDAKQVSTNQPPITKEEAWHHYKAGQQGIIDSARFLIAFSVVPWVQSSGSKLHTAASHNRIDEINFLLDDPNASIRIDQTNVLDGTTALFNAVSLGHIEATTVLLQRGADANHKSQNGITPLMISASFGHVKVSELLLDHEADPNTIQTFAKTTALHFASEMGRAGVIELLCQRGANVHKRKSTGGTALHTASDTNQTASVIVLLTVCKARPNVLLNGDTTPLYLAAQRGFSTVVKALVEHGANVNFVMPRHLKGEIMASNEIDSEGEFYSAKNTEIGNGATALHAAVENGHLKCTKMLLKLGAKQLTSMQGSSPLLIALQYKHPKIARVLLKDTNERHVNHQTPQDGAFPLFVAAGAGYVNVVKHLIRVGADVTLKTKQGATALDYARYRGKKKVVNVLENIIKSKNEEDFLWAKD